MKEQPNKRKPEERRQHKPLHHYRYNFVRNRYEEFFPRQISRTNSDGWYVTNPERVPQEYRERIEQLQEYRQANRPAKKSLPREKDHIVPTNYAYRIIHDYLKAKESLEEVEHRLLLLDILINKDETFGSLKNESIRNWMDIYDDCLTGDYFLSYIDGYLMDLIMSKQNPVEKRFTDIVYELASYLLDSKNESDKDDEYYKRNVNHSDILKNTDSDEDYDSFSDRFKIGNELIYERQALTKISKRQNKNEYHPSWQKINIVKMPREEMNVDQQQLYDEIEYLKSLRQRTTDRSEQHTLSKFIKRISDSLKQQVEPQNVGFSERNNPVDEDYTESTVQRILEELDYTDPKSIFGLIISYNDLWQKYKEQCDSPLFSILLEFSEHLSCIKLMEDVHEKILYAFINSYKGKVKKTDKCGKKDIADELGMQTESMMRTLKGSISKQIAKYFEKHVGF